MTKQEREANRQRLKRRRDKGERKICKNCGVKPAGRCRGLCWGCYEDPDIKEKFPASQRGARPEPTQEEVDAMVREGMRDLPSWWFRSDPKMD